ncbi:threonine/serine exporter family protein [Solirubrobacter sp. CPCC 204708]|uniref:Threonine/serine exporter family protein n=1 Tax=Solirubrobacter deserti TaxID=2282478 RepID=A0ABT4RJZ0_9ACTN|nr:threonine/serine exporter family protein [Solirubrobacter deserti]MBE2315848.1 threonine/serine exporter family protein [Solirubrobacter deserti]MDA0138815.1 threonine/serine exporter family protein [Solirubrobacter deserti]
MTAPRELLLELGVAALAAGRPVHEVEGEVRRVANALGYPETRVAATPTGMFVSLAPDASAGFAAVGPPLRFDQAAKVEQITTALLGKRVEPQEALDAVQDIKYESPRVSRPIVALAHVPQATGVALVLQPTVASALTAMVAAFVVAALDLLADRSQLLRTLLPVVAAFGAGCVVFLAAELDLLEAPLRTALAPVAVLLPGALIVTGMSELAQGAMVAGTARLTYGTVQLLLITFGVFLAAHVVGLHPDTLTNVRLDDLGPAAILVGVVLVGVGVYVHLSAPPGVLPWMLLGLLTTAVVQALGQHVGGAALGGFAGGVTAALVAALVHRLPHGPPSLSVFLPSFWLLVPGSLGVVTATQVATEGGEGFATATGAVAAGLAIALGVLVGAAAGNARLRA